MFTCRQQQLQQAAWEGAVTVVLQKELFDVCTLLRDTNLTGASRGLQTCAHHMRRTPSAFPLGP